MPKFRVNKYHTVLHPVDVEAEDQQAAIDAARDMKLDPAVMMDVDEITGFLVDEDGDEEFKHSRFYNADGELTREEIERQSCEVGV